MQLSDLLRQHADEILRDWELEARKLPPARGLDRPALFDHMPRLLEDFAAELASEGRLSSTRTTDALADDHAAERIDQGFSLSHLVRELSLLRTCILRCWRKTEPALSVDEVERLTVLVDRAVERAVNRYFDRRARLLEAYEQVATAAFDVQELEPFLQRLLHIVTDVAPSIDSAEILLRRGDRLYARASIGLEEEVRQGFSVRIGEGFSGTIAATKEPLLLKDAWRDPLPLSPGLRARKTRGLYGVPLLDRDTVIGVAHVGTREAEDLPTPEKRLFAAVARRAAAVIVKHRLRAEARQRVAELHAVLEAIPSAVFLGNASGLKMANPLALRLLGLSSPEELAGDVSALVARLRARDPDTREPIPFSDQPFSRALRGETVVRDAIVTDPASGEDRYTRAHAGPVKDDGEIVGVAVVVSDFTELHRALEEMKRTAEFRERFIGIVSHDLRNPMNAIKMSAGLILKGPDLPPRLARPAGRILANIERMAGIVSDLLDFTRTRLGGGIPIAPARVDLRQVAVRVIDEIEQAHPARRIVCESRGDTVGVWDGDRLAQVIANLVGNAVHHGSADAPVRVAISGGAGEVTFSVHNAGEPIPTEELPHLFDPFRSSNRTGEGAPAGLGLGLFIASAITSAHHGRIDAASGAQGTTFTVSLPRSSLLGTGIRIRLTPP